MKKIFATLVAVLAVVTTAACGSSSDNTASACSSSTFCQQIQGTWVSTDCSGPIGSAPPVYQKTTLAIADVAVNVSVKSYLDSACATTAVNTTTGSGSATIGASVNAPLGTGGPSVLAYKMDVAATVGGAPLSLFTLGYVQTGTPNRLYTGLQDATHTGTSDATRPVVLDASTWFNKQ